MGSPGWAIGGAMAIGLAESLISNSKMRKGMEIIKIATKMQLRLKNLGVFFKISEIFGSHRASPLEWRASKPVVNHGESRGGSESTQPIYIYDNSDFLVIKTGGMELAIRWTFVESYELLIDEYKEIGVPKITIEKFELDKYQITFDGDKYHFRRYSYDKVESAINFARNQLSKEAKDAENFAKAKLIQDSGFDWNEII